MYHLFVSCVTLFIDQLQGDYREFANVGQMNSPLQCAQYNGLIRKGMILAERKVNLPYSALHTLISHSVFRTTCI